MNKVFKRIRNIFALMLAVVVAVSSAAGGFGMLDTYAASKKAAKKITLSASAADEYTVSLSWNKIKSPQKGYAVFRNGQCIARLGKKKTSFTDYVDAGSTNTYTIKRWKSKGKGKKKKFKYSKASNTVSVTTPGYSWGAVNTSENSSGTKLSQSINYYGDRVMTVGGNPYRLGGSASSGLPVTYTSQNPAVATVDSSGLVRAVSPGIAIIYIRQAGDATYNPAERQAKITVTGSQNPGQGTDPGTTTDPVVVTGEFKINIPASMQTSDGRVINLNMGEVEIPITMPAHVAKIDWTESSGRAGSNDTITHRTTDNGKRLYLTAENALNNYGAFGQVQYTARLTMEEGYVFDGNSSTSFILTNTIYPMTGTFSNPVYDYEVFGRGVAGDSSRTMLAFSELPNGSTVDINIDKWNDWDKNKHIGLRVNSDFDLLTPEADCNTILRMEEHNGKILLIQAGEFELYSDRYSKKIRYRLSGGEGGYMMRYHNHLKSVAEQCYDAGNEVNSIKNCIAYIWTHYYYKRGSFFDDGYGDCGAAATFMEQVMRYSGLEAHVRGARTEVNYEGEHVNTAIVLSDGSKYVADGTALGRVLTREEAESYLSDEPAESFGGLNSCRICRWEDYNAYYGGNLDFY